MEKNSWQEDIMKKQFLEMQCLKSCREMYEKRHEIKN